MIQQVRSRSFAQPARLPSSSRALSGTLAATALLLSLSACSIGEHGDEGHHDDAEGDHHDGAAGMDDQHGEGGGHGDGDDHHEKLAGRPGAASEVSRTVTVGMSDAMDYSPASVTVARGETIRFEVSNQGDLVHEFVIGSEAEILEHHELMKRFPGMEHDEPNSIALESGASGDVVWQFTEAGEILFACLQPGHYEAGMKGEVMVGGAS